MMVSVKKSVIFLTIILLLVSFVSSVTTVQVQEQKPEEKGWFSKYFGFLKSPLFWGVLILIIIIFLLILGLIFLIGKLLKYFKERSDIYVRLKSDRIKLSKIQKRYSSTHYWKVHKNTPIRLVKKTPDGKAFFTEPLGFYRGDYTTQEGNIIISLNLKSKKKYFLFPITDVLIIPDRKEINIEQSRKEGKKENKVVVENLPRAKDLIQFNPNEILIFAESLSYVGKFLTLVIRTKDDKIMDLSLPIFQSLKEVVMNDYLYEQTNEFVVLSKQAMNLNPNIRSIIKTGDSQNVDIPTGEDKR
jgi:uncharacterized membrane protein